MNPIRINILDPGKGQLTHNIALSEGKRKLTVFEILTGNPIEEYNIENQTIGLYIEGHDLVIENPKNLPKEQTYFRFGIKKNDDGQYTNEPKLKLKVIGPQITMIGSDDHRMGKIVFDDFDGPASKVNIRFMTHYGKEYIEVRY